jgi:hypothetical protein
MGVSIRIDTRARPKERNEKSQFYEAFFYILSLGRALHLISIKWTTHPSHRISHKDKKESEILCDKGGWVFEFEFKHDLAWRDKIKMKTKDRENVVPPC